MDQKGPSSVHILRRVQKSSNLENLTKNSYEVLTVIGEEKDNVEIDHAGDTDAKIVMEADGQKVDQVKNVCYTDSCLQVYSDSEEMLSKAGKGKAKLWKAVGLKTCASMDNLVECPPSSNAEFQKQCKKIRDAKAREKNKRVKRASSKAQEFQSLSGNQ